MSVPQNILLVGASGFIGKALCAHLKAAWPKANFHTVARATSNIPNWIQKHILDDWSLISISKRLRGYEFDVIINLAAYGVSPANRDITSMHSVNTILPSTLVQLAHQHGARIIHAGSSAEYGPTTDLYLDEVTSPLNSQSLYGASKASGAILAASVAAHLNVDFINLRLFNVYGPGEAPHRLFPSLIEAARLAHDTRQVMALSDGLQIRDFIHIEDVCRAFEMAASRSKLAPSQSSLNICSGVPISVKDFTLSVFSALTVDPSSLNFGAIKRREDDLQRVVGAPGRAASDIGFQITEPLQATLVRTLSQRMDAA